MGVNIPVFITLEEQEQAIALRMYLKEKGADISEEVHADGPIADLYSIIDAFPIALKEGTEQEIEGVFNNIVHLMLLLELSEDKTEDLINRLCKQLQTHVPSDKQAAMKLSLLNNLFNSIPESSFLRYAVFITMLQLAGPAECVELVQTDVAQVKSWIDSWKLSQSKTNELWRLMHDALLASKKNEKATKVMLELLSGYTDENASQAKEDAHRCIVTSLADPSTYVFDSMLSLKPVKFLEGELIHDLLVIFVSGNLGQYVDFYTKHRTFVESLELSHDQNMRKMRLLTFMQLAENSEEISFDTISREMQLQEEILVEQFVVDVIRSGAVKARMDQVNGKVLISGTTHRTFGRQQWQYLREQLDRWQSNLTQILGSLHSVAATQVR